MNLPVIEHPLFELKYPSQNRDVLSRRFLVKEEKILLTAQQSGEDRDILLAIKQILTNCIQDKDFDASKLAVYDLEYMFLKLRAQSVGNKIEVTYIDNEDEKSYEFEVDLDKVILINEEKRASNQIQLDDEVGIMMKLPSIDMITNIPKDITQTELIDYIVINCIDKIYDKEAVYPADQVSEKELKDFVDQLTVEQYSKISDWFDNLPSMSYTIEYENSLGHERKIELKTLDDFFNWR